MRREQGLNLIELKIVIGILAALVLILVPSFLIQRSREKKKQELVDLLRARLGGADGPAVAGAEVFVHDGVRALRQTLPALPAHPTAGHSVIELDGRRVLLTPRWYRRWLISPLTALLALGGVGLMVWEWREERREGLPAIALVGFFVTLLLLCAWISQDVIRWELDGPRARLTGTSTALGFRSGPDRVHEKIAGIAAVPVGGDFAVVAFPRDGSPVELFRTPADSRGVAGVLNGVLVRWLEK